MFSNVTGRVADLAVLLPGEGAKTTVPVPEHGTTILVEMSFGRKKSLKLARPLVLAAGARAAVIVFPALPVYPTSKVEVGDTVFTSTCWLPAGWPVFWAGPGHTTLITALPGGWLLM